MVFSFITAEVKNWPPDRLELTNKDIIAGWISSERDPPLAGVNDIRSEVIWRSLYLSQSISDIQSLETWVVVMSIKRLGIPLSEQLELAWWMYLVRASEFQDRCYKFYAASCTFAASHGSTPVFTMEKKKFCKQFLSPLKSLVELRDHWLHDSKPDLFELKRLSSLELFIKLYERDPADKQLCSLLKRNAKKLGVIEKNKIISTIQANQSSIRNLANGVARHVFEFIDINHFRSAS